MPLTTEALAEVLPVLLPVEEALAVTLLLALVLPLADAVCTKGGGMQQLHCETVNSMCNDKRATLRPPARTLGGAIADTARCKRASPSMKTQWHWSWRWSSRRWNPSR